MDHQWILDTISGLNSEGQLSSIDRALLLLADKLRLDRCILRYRKPGSDVFTVIAEYHAPELKPINVLEPEMDSGASLNLVQQLLEYGKVEINDIFAETAFNEDELQKARDWSCRAFLFLPLRYRNSINGMIIAVQGQQPRQWCDTDKFTVQLIGETALSVWLNNRSVKALSASRQQYQRALEISNDALFDWDIHAGLFYQSLRFFQMLARPFQNSTTVDELLSWVQPDDLGLLQDKMANAAAGKLLKTDFELRMLDSNGEIVWLMVRAAMVEFDESGLPTRGMGTISDITTFKKTLQHLELLRQNAEQANKAKSEFLARMSHEVRTPLNAITGMLHLLQDSMLNDEQQTKVQIMQDASRQLLTVLNDILDISRIESGKLELECIPFDMDRLLQQLVAMFSAQAAEKEIDLMLAVEGDISSRVMGDPNRLLQVLGNLLSNALKFTERGEVVLKLVCKPVDLGNMMMEFSVADTGAGMTEEQLERLFNPFVQAELNIAREYGGSGLGLSICKNLVELMGGHIRVHSAYGSGSRFQFSIAVERDETETSCKLFLPDIAAGRSLLLCRSSQSAAIYQQMFASVGLDCMALPATTSPRQLQTYLQTMPQADHIFIDSRFDEADIQILSQWLQAAKPGQVILLATVLNRPLQKLLDQYTGLQLLLKPLTPQKLLRFWRDEYAEKNAGSQPVFSLSQADLQRLQEMRVLLVEDNLINQMVAQGILAKYGVQSVACEHGKAAVDEIYNQPEGYFQAVFMDLEMPVMDGFEATRLIRQMDKARQLPIVAMTANTLHDDIKRCQHAGMAGHVGKPVEPQKLISSLLQL